jgi:hypothetical protein
MINQLKYYYIKPCLIGIYIWQIIIYSSSYELDIIDSSFFHCGPGDSVFIVTPINTWRKWWGVMIYSFTSQIVYSFVTISLAPFISNVIRDYKSEKNLSYKYSIFIVFSYKSFIWMHEILEVFLTLTLQLQYYLPAIIADIIIALCSTHYYMVSNAHQSKNEQTNQQYSPIINH